MSRPVPVDLYARKNDVSKVLISKTSARVRGSYPPRCSTVLGSAFTGVKKTRYLPARGGAHLLSHSKPPQSQPCSFDPRIRELKVRVRMKPSSDRRHCRAQGLGGPHGSPFANTGPNCTIQQKLNSTTLLLVSILPTPKHHAHGDYESISGHDSQTPRAVEPQRMLAGEPKLLWHAQHKSATRRIRITILVVNFARSLLQL